MRDTVAGRASRVRPGDLALGYLQRKDVGENDEGERQVRRRGIEHQPAALAAGLQNGQSGGRFPRNLSSPTNVHDLNP